MELRTGLGGVMFSFCRAMGLANWGADEGPAVAPPVSKRGLFRLAAPWSIESARKSEIRSFPPSSYGGPRLFWAAGREVFECNANQPKYCPLAPTDSDSENKVYFYVVDMKEGPPSRLVVHITL